MSFLKKMFGLTERPQAPKGIDYNGYRIIPEPVAEGGRFRLSARIEKVVDGDLKVHQVIRADVLDTKSAADEVSITKAKQVIDEQGDRLFS